MRSFCDLSGAALLASMDHARSMEGGGSGVCCACATAVAMDRKSAAVETERGKSVMDSPYLPSDAGSEPPDDKEITNFACELLLQRLRPPVSSWPPFWRARCGTPSTAHP